MSTITKKQFIAQYAKEAKLNQKAAKEYVDLFLELLIQDLVEGNDVDITGFGKFVVHDRPVRIGMNPVTKEKIEIPASRIVKFTSKKGLRDAVNPASED